MPFCAKKRDILGISASLITMGRLRRWRQSKQWHAILAHAGKKMERARTRGDTSSYDGAVSFAFINACRPSCRGQNIRVGRRASFGPNGADVAHGISAAYPVLLVTTECTY